MIYLHTYRPYWLTLRLVHNYSRIILQASWHLVSFVSYIPTPINALSSLLIISVFFCVACSSDVACVCMALGRSNVLFKIPLCRVSVAGMFARD